MIIKYNIIYCISALLIFLLSKDSNSGYKHIGVINQLNNSSDTSYIKHI